MISNENNLNEHISFRAYLISRRKDASPLLFSFLQLLGSISVENTEYLLRLEFDLKEKKKIEKITEYLSAFVELIPENGIICAVLCGEIISENNFIM